MLSICDAGEYAMPLSCFCDFDPYDDGAWFFDAPDDYQPLDRHRAVRCASCKALIKQ
jgi:hypothetical protein